MARGEIEKGNLQQAKERCQDCMALIVHVTGAWWCDEADSPVEEVTACKEWED